LILKSQEHSLKDKLLFRVCQQIWIIVLMAVPLTSCAAGTDLSKLNVDETIQTTAFDNKQNSTQISDAFIIRNAVSAVDLTNQHTIPLNWANHDTGSMGAISEIAESRTDGLLCRNFKTSRISFEGIANYVGAACINNQNKQWYVRSFVLI
jgi:hypothetical protein